MMRRQKMKLRKRQAAREPESLQLNGVSVDAEPQKIRCE
jgi:hypothetical protein